MQKSKCVPFICVVIIDRGSMQNKGSLPFEHFGLFPFCFLKQKKIKIKNINENCINKMVRARRINFQDSLQHHLRTSMPLPSIFLFFFFFNILIRLKHTQCTQRLGVSTLSRYSKRLHRVIWSKTPTSTKITGDKSLFFFFSSFVFFHYFNNNSTRWPIMLICGWKRTTIVLPRYFDESARSATCYPSCAKRGFPRSAEYAPLLACENYITTLDFHHRPFVLSLSDKQISR